MKTGKNATDPKSEVAVLNKVVVEWNERAWKSVIVKERSCHQRIVNTWTNRDDFDCDSEMVTRCKVRPGEREGWDNHAWRLRGKYKKVLEREGPVEIQPEVAAANSNEPWVGRKKLVGRSKNLVGRSKNLVDRSKNLVDREKLGGM